MLRALPGGDSSALVRHRRSMLTSALRLKRTATHRLDASDGHRDHTTWADAQRRCQWGASPPRSAPRSVVVRARMTAHGALAMEETRPAAKLSRRTLPRPPHPAPRTVTIAKRPSHRDGMKLGILSYRNFVKASGGAPELRLDASSWPGTAVRRTAPLRSPMSRPSTS